MSCKGGAWGLGGGGLALAFGLGLGLLGLGGGVLLAILEAGFFLGGLGGAGLGLGALGGGVLSPLPVLLVLLLLLLLLLLVCPARSCTLTQPLRCKSMPPAILPASHLPKPSSTERAKLGSVPIIWPNSVTPTRRVRPPPSRHSTDTRTLRGSAPHVCTLRT